MKKGHLKKIFSPKFFAIRYTIYILTKFIVLIENNSEWEAEVKRRSRIWKTHIKEWLNVKEFPLLIVVYENLENNTYTELKRMLDFLEYPYSEDDISCAVKTRSENFHRWHTKDIHPYSPELQQIILGEIKEVDADLKKT